MNVNSKVRIDKWLWAARFYKSRSLSTAAVDGGHVHVNRARVKPSRAVSVGEIIQIKKQDFSIEVEILALADRRGSATVAEKLYRETEQSSQARAEKNALHLTNKASRYASRNRPDKRDRRKIRVMLGKD